MQFGFEMRINSWREKWVPWNVSDELKRVSRLLEENRTLVLWMGTEFFAKICHETNR
jgi:hypothetical protein